MWQKGRQGENSQQKEKSMNFLSVFLDVFFPPPHLHTDESIPRLCEVLTHTFL